MEPIKILVVDDDSSIRSMIRIALSLEPGIGEVRDASDGVDAIEVCGDFQPDVVILDYWMPEMDGQDAAARIRSLHPEARIIAYSAVLEDTPEWADERLAKDAIPEPSYLIDLVRAEQDSPPVE